MQQSKKSTFSRIAAATILAVSCTSGLFAQSGPVVWVVPSLTRVGPSDPAGSGTEAQIEAGRNEYESYQVIVRAPSGGLSNVNFAVSDLSGPGGATISKSNITLYREHYVDVTSNSPAWSGSANMPLATGWYPDGLIPFVDPDTKAPLSGAALTAVPFTLAASQNQPIWVDVYVPSGAAPGAYTGTYTVSCDQGNFTGQVALTVWHFTLPAKSALHSSFEVWQANNLPTNEELLRNRIEPLYVPSSEESTLMANYGLNDLDLGYFSGANVGSCTMSAAPPVSQIQSAVASQQPGLALYDYSADEIGSCTNLYSTIQQWGRNLHQGGVDQLITMAPVSALFDDGSGTGRSAVDIWGVLPDTYDANVSSVQAALQKGDQVWSYNTLVQDSYSPKWEIDFAPIDFRIQGGFINQVLGLNGLLYWRVDMWSSDAWNNVYAYPGSYPGEAMLIYPGSTVGIPGSAPSMRLKWLRDSADDFDYIQLLKAAGQGAAALKTAATVAASWSNWTRDPNVLYNARHQLGQMLDSLGGGQASNVPAAPVNPTPANGATGVSTSTVLTWTGDSKATSYDVYFDTVSNPALASNVTSTSFSPGSLVAGTKYYWRVVAKNSSGNTSSATWSLTTAAAVITPPPPPPPPVVTAPTAPVNLSPANGAAGVSLAPALTWSASTGATSYQIYFGTTQSPALAGTATGTSYSPGTLTAGTTYYWRVVAVNSGGTAASAQAAFTTTPPAPTPTPSPAPSGPVSPSSGTGASQTFTFTFSGSNLSAGTVIFNSRLQWTNSCWIVYMRSSNRIWLASDDTVTWTSGVPGSSGVLQNSQCSVSVADASVSVSSSSITEKIPVTFTPSFAGDRNVYMSNSANTKLVQEGSWIVP